MSENRFFVVDGNGGFEGLEDDIQMSAAGINPPGGPSDAVRNVTSGLLEFSGTAVNVIALSIQMPHSYDPGDPWVPHIHIYANTDPGAGPNNVSRWELKYKVSAIDGIVPAGYTTVTVNKILTQFSGGRPFHQICSFGVQSGAGMSESSVVEMIVSRIGDNVADTFAGVVSLLSVDIHYLKKKLGKNITLPTP
jgi:hypothetical protein